MCSFFFFSFFGFRGHRTLQLLWNARVVEGLKFNVINNDAHFGTRTMNAVPISEVSETGSGLEDVLYIHVQYILDLNLLSLADNAGITVSLQLNLSVLCSKCINLNFNITLILNVNFMVAINICGIFKKCFS